MKSMSQYQTYIHQSRYARWNEKKKRRETWEETVDRYIDFFSEKIEDNKLREETMSSLKNKILNLDIMPSMRAMMTAGKALEKDNVAGYNCSFIIVDDPRAFDEAMYISMCGTGVGFSVERQFINEMPEIADEFYPSGTIIKVKDSKIGWATAFRELISLLYIGKIPTWDTSEVRPAGAILKTFGGRASGPAPLERLFKFTVSLFKNAAGRKLNSLECHDLMCFIADVVVSGGVRRSAMISLSNLSDERMRNAKTGQWWETSVQRSLANNSSAYTEKPGRAIFMDEWNSLYRSKSGERGIFNRRAARKQAAKTGRRVFEGVEFGTNPCGEIILRPNQFCNLTEVVIRPSDTLETLLEKVEYATILGTLQSTLTKFRYLRKIWQKNCEEERLLGVSLTGIMDNEMTSTPGPELNIILDKLKQHAIDVNKKWASILGINQSTSITTVKPSGTVSQLVDSASGIHPRYSLFYIRTVRSDMKDPLGKMLLEQGVPCEPDETKPNDVMVFSFPMKSPNHSIFRNDRTAIEQLEMYLTYKIHWCEHNPSITVYVREHEWLEVGAWVYKNFDLLGGVSFLPADEGKTVYRQAPYQEISEEEYVMLASKMPEIVWDSLKTYEQDDQTTSAKELACSAGVCELI